MARAKRERVAQDEVEKANRRPTDPTDTTDPTPRKAFLTSEHFRRKNAILVSKAFFTSAFFDANLRFWPEKLSSQVHFSTQN